MAGGTSGTLNDRQRHQIVCWFAEFNSPTEVVELVKEHFGIEMTREALHYYDAARPANVKGKLKLSDKWEKVFWEHRDAWRAKVENIGISNKVYRLARLDAMAKKAERMRNYALAAQLHEQAAKEMGGYFTNKRDLSIDVTATLAALLGVAPGQLPNRSDFHLSEAQRLKVLGSGGNGKEPSTNGARKAG